MSPKRAEKFEQLKQQAIITLHELDLMSGDGSIIHDRNQLRGVIVSWLHRLEKKGEKIIERTGWNGKRRTIFITLDAFEQKLKEANQWITKIKLRGR